MEDIAIFRINYKSDFVLTLNSDAGWMTPFCIKFWTGAPSQAYFASYDGTNYTHCAPVDGEPTKLRVQFDDHHLPIGDLMFQIGYHFTVADFPTSVEDEVLNQASVIIEVDDAPAQVMLDLNGETAPEIEFSLPAYANEAQRIANEEQRIAAEAIRIVNEESRIAAETIRQQNEAQRISNEESRVAEFAQLKQESETATADANAAATLANEKAALAADKAALADDAATLANAKAQLAADKAALADAAATLANDKAALAQQKAAYAQEQGDYAKAQGDYAKAQSETAQADHERAESDHTRAESDHTQAGTDHTRAESDHTTAASDHTQAGTDHTRSESDHATASADHTQAGQDHTRAESDHATASADHTQAGTDHTRAESDHTRAESDHAAVEVYVDSLGAFDISAYHATGGVLAKYADLTAALGTNGANIPDALRKGGMSVKFVLSSDNMYVQYRFMLSGSFTNAQFTNVLNWQGVDDGIIPNSQNLTKGEAVYDEMANLDIARLQADGYIEKIMNITVSGEHSSSADKIKYRVPAGDYSIVINDVDSGNVGFFINAYYSDGTSGHISGYIFNIGEAKNLTIDKDIVEIGVYKGTGATEGKISIKFTDRNYVSKKQIEEGISGLNNRLDKLGVTNLYARQGSIPSDLPIGQCYYNWNTNKIVYKVSESSYREYTPTKDGLYRYNDKYYQYDGVGLVEVYDAYIKAREIQATLLFLSTLKLKQGALHTSGSNIPDTEQLRPDDSIYIKGKYTLRLPEGFIFRRICSYSVEDKSFLGRYDKDPATGDVITIGTYDNGETTVDCLTRFTIKKRNGGDITPDELISRCYSDILLDRIIADKGELVSSISSNYSEFLNLVDNTTEPLKLVAGKVMYTGNAVGQTASFEENTSPGWRYIKLTVKAGETYFVRGAVSGTNPKAITLTDINGVITKLQTSKNFTGIINIEVNGYLVVNGTSSSGIKVSALNGILVRKHTLNVLDSAGLYQGSITTAGGIDKTDTEQIYSGIIRENTYLMLPSGFKLRRVVYYNSTTGAFDSRDEIDPGTEASVYKEGCYARVSIKKIDNSNITPDDFPINNIGASIDNNKKAIDALDEEINKKHSVPLLNFDPDYTWKDSFASELNGMASSLAKNTIPSDYLEKIYAKIDELVALNPEYITKYEPLATEVTTQTVIIDGTDYTINVNPFAEIRTALAEKGVTDYPIYANGISEPITESITLSGFTYDATYGVTPAYKTYIYKLSHIKNGLYGRNVKKKTIFITACTHGWEKAGSFNTYLLMKRLCEDYVNSDFYMKLRSLFDIYVIPCLNGYGIYHGQRVNARKVNINRNAPSPGWHIIGEPGHQDFSGEPGSEFETKIVVSLIDYLKPDIYFDHHNFTPDSAMISFTSGKSKLPCAPYFRAMVDFTRCSMKYLPQHFGTKFNIIASADPEYYPNGSATDIGELHGYGYYKGVEFSFVLEVDYAIPFTNGVYTGFTGLQTNTDNTYRLNEYILRSQLIHYCNAVLNMKK